MGVLVAMVILLSRAFVVSNSVMGAAIKDAAELSGERARTMLSFETSTSNGTDITVDVKNTGGTCVSDYEDMDFIVVYEDATTATIVSHLAYVSGSAGTNEWTRATTTPDLFQPRIWDPGETITLDANISPAQNASSTGTLRVSTPNGVVATGTFTAP